MTLLASLYFCSFTEKGVDLTFQTKNSEDSQSRRDSWRHSSQLDSQANHHSSVTICPSVAESESDAGG